MIFTVPELISITKTVGIPFDRLKAHLIYQGENITADIRTAVLAEISAYEAVPSNGVEFYPTESNKGFKKTSDSQRLEFQTNIRNLLNIDGGGLRRLQRS